jgi:hypothetical protein
VARASSLFGPYVKDPANPLLAGNAAWRCPGHGTTLDLGPPGLFLLHHAYRADDLDDRRRSALLDRIDIGADGWPTIAGGQGPAVTIPDPFGAAEGPAPTGFTDRFDGGSLAPGWEWPFFAVPDARPAHGALSMKCRRSTRQPSFVARQVPVDRFTAAATVAAPRPGGPAVGLAAHGPGRVLRGIELRGGSLRAFRADDRGLAMGPATPAPGGARLRLLISATPDGTVAFYAGGPASAPARVAGGPAEAGLPATRVALTCRGTGSARVDSVRVVTSGVER